MSHNLMKLRLWGNFYQFLEETMNDSSVMVKLKFVS